MSVARWGLQTVPELILIPLAIRFVLWVVADAVLTVSTSYLWLLHRAEAPAPVKKQPAPVAVSPAGKRIGGAAGAFICIAVLAGSVGGCSPSYNGERLFWKAQQSSEAIVKDPAKATPQDYRKAIDGFQQVVTKVPGTTWAGKAQLAIGSLYALQKDFDKAREAYTLVLRNHGNQKEQALSARYAIAKTYELESRWDDAIKLYGEIADLHTWSRMGLEAPLYIGALHQKLNRTEEAAKAFDRAVRVYTKLIPEAPNPGMQSQLRGYVAAAYQQQGKYAEALAVLEEMARSEGVNRPLLLMTIGSLYQVRLSSPEKAKETYLQVVNEFPNDPLAKTARERLAKLGMPAESIPQAPAPAPTPDAQPPTLAPAPAAP
jgi:tetratricopeptide (TPR) repeat protein